MMHHTFPASCLAQIIALMAFEKLCPCGMADIPEIYSRSSPLRFSNSSLIFSAIFCNEDNIFYLSPCRSFLTFGRDSNPFQLCTSLKTCIGLSFVLYPTTVLLRKMAASSSTL